MRQIRKINIIGMGALGLLYGSIIADHLGAEAVTYVMDQARCEKYRGRKFTCNGKEYVFRMAQGADAGTADLVIVAVKGPGLEEALESVACCVGEDTILFSVLNGISSEEAMAARFGAEKLVYTVAQGMDAMKFGDVLTYTKAGELRVGIVGSGKRENLEAVEAFFREAGIAFTEEDDIMRRMWGKFMLNVGVNQTCMVYDTTYAGALSPGEANRTMIAAMREVIAVANAEGIGLGERDLNQYITILGTLSPEGMPSMEQDRVNRKPSEVEMFAGTVIRLARKHQICVPSNEFLYERVREIEQGYMTDGPQGRAAEKEETKWQK